MTSNPYGPASRNINRRLDDLNDAIKQFFGGKLSLAPLEGLQPTAILEIG